MPRYLVVEANPRGYMDKDVDCNFYPCADKGEAEELAQGLYEDLLGTAMCDGGYPGATYVLDTHDPTHFQDTEAALADIRSRNADPLDE